MYLETFLSFFRLFKVDLGTGSKNRLELTHIEYFPYVWAVLNILSKLSDPEPNKDHVRIPSHVRLALEPSIQLLEEGPKESKVLGLDHL